MAFHASLQELGGRDFCVFTYSLSSAITVKAERKVSLFIVTRPVGIVHHVVIDLGRSLLISPVPSSFIVSPGLEYQNMLVDVEHDIACLQIVF